MSLGLTSCTTYRCCGADYTVNACYEWSQWLTCPVCGEWFCGSLKGEITTGGGVDMSAKVFR